MNENKAPGSTNTRKVYKPPMTIYISAKNGSMKNMNQKLKRKMYDQIRNKQKKQTTTLGNPRDDVTFLNYKHKLDECNTKAERYRIIKKYKPLPDSVFESNNI